MYKLLLITVVLGLALTQQAFNGKDYEALNREQKQNNLWNAITKDNSSGTFPGVKIAGIFLESMQPSFDFVSDVLPEGRKKYIHSVGVVAKASFVPEAGNPYTGALAGADSLLIRLSLAKQPDTSKTTPKGALDNFTPGLGLKFLRNGVSSGNLVAMFGVNGFESWNFFHKDASTHIPDSQGIVLKFLSSKFSTATPRIGVVGLKNIADFTESGEQVKQPKFPFRLIFRATDEVRNLFPDTYEDGYLAQLQRIPSDANLYEVFAIGAPNQCEVKIGTIKLTSSFVTSKFGDHSLFFRHGRVEDDLKLNPTWDEYIQKFSFWGGKKAKESKCPLGF